MRKIGFAKAACIVAAFCAGTAATSLGQTFATLTEFDGANGGNAEAALVQGSSGNFYGAAAAGGGKGLGTVFDVTPAGILTTLHNFCSKTNCADGGGTSPGSALLLAANGNLYGTTSGGGAYSEGTVFEITPAGKLTTLYSFCSQALCADGSQPLASLVEGVNGNFYGTTYAGGGTNTGTVFEITPAGKLTTLYSFCSQSGCTDGAYPQAALVLGSDGNFYGTTAGAGDEVTGYGTIFKISPAGKLVTLHSFDYTDGENPQAALVQGANGDFYGTAYSGGSHNKGTIFQITRGGKFTLLYIFCSLTNCTDGGDPAGLVLGSDGNFYGTTELDGGHDYGEVFEFTPAAKLTTLYSFCSEKDCADGIYPLAGLVQGTDGSFYGTTWRGGTSTNCTGDCGTIFSISTGLGPFVAATPNFGKVGYTISILGNDLTGATGVSFNGTPATTFTVVSPTLIKATVPAGATAGTIEVTTPGGTLSSNVTFQILP